MVLHLILLIGFSAEIEIICFRIIINGAFENIGADTQNEIFKSGELRPLEFHSFIMNRGIVFEYPGNPLF